MKSRRGGAVGVRALPTCWKASLNAETVVFRTMVVMMLGWVVGGWLELVV